MERKSFEITELCSTYVVGRVMRYFVIGTLAYSPFLLSSTFVEFFWNRTSVPVHQLVP